jgi:hypothetical protein
MGAVTSGGKSRAACKIEKRGSKQIVSALFAFGLHDSSHTAAGRLACLIVEPVLPIVKATPSPE